MGQSYQTVLPLLKLCKQARSWRNWTIAARQCYYLLEQSKILLLKEVYHQVMNIGCAIGRDYVTDRLPAIVRSYTAKEARLKASKVSTIYLIISSRSAMAKFVAKKIHGITT